MATKKKMLQAAAGSATGGAGLDIDEVYSTYLYDGNGSTQTITNGIDLDGEGGLVWYKGRDTAGGGASQRHSLYDTERGAAERLMSNSTDPEATESTALTSFNSTGFTLGSDAESNQSGYDYASWTFRKAPKFFDVVTYTGNGVAGRTISHDLGTTVGMLVVKSTSHATDWKVQHRSVGATIAMELNNTRDATDVDDAFWDDTPPTDTHFTVGSNSGVNASGRTYVAYLFAHNDGDGGFGPDGDADVIKCGSYTGNGSTDGPEIDLGFEPQFVILKRSSGTEDWLMFDNMRGMVVGGIDPDLRPNQSQLEGAFLNYLEPNATGFKLIDPNNRSNGSGDTYMAIRRGPLAPPESATEVFDVSSYSSNGNSNIYNTGFNADMNINTDVAASENNYIIDRLRGRPYLKTNDTGPDANGTSTFWNAGNNLLDIHTAWWANHASVASWSWKRAPGFFDAVAYTGNGSPSYQTINHNLKAVPQLLICKSRDTSTNWPVVVENHGASTALLSLNTTSAHGGTGTYQDGYITGNNSDSTFLAFTGGSSVTASNASGVNYIAYLFASLPGISKVGSYTGTGATLNIDCGFTSGARFVLIKNTTGGNWYVYDTARGIVSGNDPALELNSTSAEDNQYDSIDPYSAGFTLTAYGASSPSLNTPSETYIFYAIA